MKSLGKEEFKNLMEHSGKICISIYMPTFRTGSETQQSRIVLKNLLKQAEKQLLARGHRFPEVKLFLDPAKMLLKDNYFWQFQLDGFALFLGEDYFDYYSLPVDFEQIVVVNNRFHLKPLLPWVSSERQFFVLALSQNKIRILRCSRASVTELSGDLLPKDLADALRFDDPQREVQFHTNTLESKSGRAAAIYHGNGSNSDDTKDRILRYFNLVDRGMKKLLRNENSPLILSGVDFLFPLYREVNTYPYLLEEGIPGNPEEVSADDLHKKAWEIVKSTLDQKVQEALQYYGPFRGTGRTSSQVNEIVPAAINGQTELLFVANNGQQWGHFNAESGRVESHETPQEGDEDLLDLASLQTLLNGGSVFVMEAEQIPDGQNIAALFRY